jgi:transcriptional repressor NrdR
LILASFEQFNYFQENSFKKFNVTLATTDEVSHYKFMLCPFCNFPNSRVLESRAADESSSIRRRRECLECRKRFTTYERVEFVPLVVIKRSGKRESFDRFKILKGVTIACEKTGVTPLQIEALVNDIEVELQQRALREVTSQSIGERVLLCLRELNEVAYVRFASVYRKFQGINDFVEELGRLPTDQMTRAKLEDILHLEHK